MPNEEEFHQYIDRTIALFTEGNIAHINLREHSFDEALQKKTIEHLYQLQDRLLEIIKQHQTFSEGNDKFYLVKKSYNDQMWLSLNHLKDLHQHLITSMTALSQGDLRLTNIAKTYKGELGSILTDLINYLQYLVQQAHQISTGNYLVDIKPKDNNDELGSALKKITHNFRNIINENEKDLWLNSGQLQLYKLLQKNMDIEDLCTQIISFLARYIDAQVGVFYTINNDNKILLTGSFAYNRRKKIVNTITPGEGLIGQALIEKQIIIVSQIPPGYINIESGLGEESPKYLAIIPLITDGVVQGIIELGAFESFEKSDLDLLSACSENIAIAIREKKSVSSQNSLIPINNPSMHLNSSQAKELDCTKDEIQKKQQLIEQLQNELILERKKTQASLNSMKESCLSIQQEEEKLTALNNKYLEDRNKLIKKEMDLKNQQLKIDQEKLKIEQAQQKIIIDKKSIEEEKSKISTSQRALGKKTNILHETPTKTQQTELFNKISDELLSPTNNLLKLAKSFTENKEENLTDKQKQSAYEIESSGLNLLNIINNFQELYRLENGDITLNIEDLCLSYIENDILNEFKPLAESKNFDFLMEFDQAASGSIETDCQRLLHVIKHLLSNAFKFTKQGTVSLNITKPSPKIHFNKNGLNTTNSIAFSIRDTGIGISKERQRNIFETCSSSIPQNKQNESINFGLPHAHKITTLLGGELQLESMEGIGSTFTLLMPIKYPGSHAKTLKASKFSTSKPLLTDNTLSDTNSTMESNQKPAAIENNKANFDIHTIDFEQSLPDEVPLLQTQAYPDDFKSINEDEIHEPVNLTDYAIPQFMPDDREQLNTDNKIILIADDDEDFATVLREKAQKKHYQCIVAGDGKSCLHLVAQYQPDAIILSLELPDMDGLTVLDLLKHDLTTCHIPVFTISNRDKAHQAHQKGAIGFLQKTTNEPNLEQVFDKFNNILLTEIKHILLIEDSSEYQNKLIEALNADKLRINAMSLAHAANSHITLDQYDCVIIDPDSPDIDGLTLLKTLFSDKDLCETSVIINTWGKLSNEERGKFSAFSPHIINKNQNSVEDLLSTVNSVLHQHASPTASVLENNEHSPADDPDLLYGRTVLLVDDDLRNTFELSNILEDKGLNVIIAENGQKALDELNSHNEVDVVMMDILMPVMDGFEAMQKIRQQEKYFDLPIIALTNKAMVDDKTKCLQVGANNYMDKPVDIDQLFSILETSLK